MKNKHFLVGIGATITAGVVALMVMAGMNLSQTVEQFAVIAREESAQTVNDSVIARVDEPTVQDLTGADGYVAPLGETSVTGPNMEKVMATAVGAQGMILGVLAVCLVVIISLVVRYLRRDRNQVK